MRAIKAREVKSVEKQIHIDQKWKLQFWMEKFESSEEDLLIAIDRVGRNLSDLERHFNKYLNLE